MTGLIGLFHLYPTIPNISLVYLLVIFVLASTLGRYAAVSCIGDCFPRLRLFPRAAFDTFVIARWEEWIALFVLVTALLTSQLSAVMRQRTDQAQQQVRETSILYESLAICQHA